MMPHGAWSDPEEWSNWNDDRRTTAQKYTLFSFFFCNLGYHKSDSAQSAVQSQNFLPPADDRRKRCCGWQRQVSSSQCSRWHFGWNEKNGPQGKFRFCSQRGNTDSFSGFDETLSSYGSQPSRIGPKRRTHLRCLEKRCGSDFWWIQRGVSHLSLCG